MASPPTVKQSIILHNEMISFIGLNLVPDMNEFTQFKTNAGSYLPAGDIARAKGAEDILRSLETRGHLSTRNYDTLIGILGNSHLIQLQAEVQIRAIQIRRQIVLENDPAPPNSAFQTKANDAQIRAKSTLYRSDCHNRTKGFFVRTTLYDQARKEIEEKNAVLLLGGIGDGKSSITRYIAANCMKDYLPVPCSYPEEIQQYIDLIQGTNIKLLLVFDDPVGGSYTQHILVDKWVHMLEKLEMYLAQNEHKFLFAMRKTIWADCGIHLKKSKFFCNQIEITSANLSPGDKVRMLEKYLGNSGKLSDRHKQKIVADEKPIAFGQCCKLMSDVKGLSSEELVLVFQKPFSYLCSELEKLADKEKEKYATLCVVMLCGSTLERKQLRGTLSDVKPDVKTIIDDVVVACKGPNLTRGDLYESAEKLTGTHLEKLQQARDDSSSCEVYQFSHDSIYESVTMHYGQLHPEHCLKYLNPVIVVNIARSHDYEKREQEFAINFPPENYKELAGMFTTKVIDENGKFGLSKVFDNPCVKDEPFQSVWVDCLKNSLRDERTAFTQSKDRNGRCVLYYLARSGAHTVLSFLCPDCQSECKCGWPLPCVLWGAIGGKHVQLVRECLPDRALTRDEACRAVWEACRYDCVDVLSSLFDQTSINVHAIMVGSGLGAACEYGGVRSVDYLLTHHCTPCRRLQQDCPCVEGLWVASRIGQTDIITLIESHRKPGH